MTRLTACLDCHDCDATMLRRFAYAMHGMIFGKKQSLLYRNFSRVVCFFQRRALRTRRRLTGGWRLKDENWGLGLRNVGSVTRRIRVDKQASRAIDNAMLLGQFLGEPPKRRRFLRKDVILVGGWGCLFSLFIIAFSRYKRKASKLIRDTGSQICPRSEGFGE